MQGKDRITIKWFLLTVIIICIGLHVVAQGRETPDSLNHIINDSRNSAENRIQACVRQGEYYINKPGGNPKDVDSALASLNYGKRLSKTLYQHNDDGELLFLGGLISKKKGSGADGNQLNDQAITLLRKKPANYFLGEALLEKGDYLNTDDDNQLKDKIAVLKEALSCFDDVKYAWIRARVWKSLGDIYELHRRVPGNVALALEAYQRSMDTYFSYGYRNVQDIYIELAVIYRDLGDEQQALRYCLMAVQTAERAKDISLTTFEIYNVTGIQYMGLLDYPNAAKYFTQALKLAEKFNHKTDIFQIGGSVYAAYAHGKEYKKAKHLIDTIRSLFPENDPQNQYFSDIFYLRYYTAIDRPADGKKYCGPLIKLIGDGTSPILSPSPMIAYLALSEYYTMAHSFANAYKYWNKTYSIMSEHALSPENKFYLLNLHYKIDTASHNLVSGISYLQQYTTLRDSTYTANKAAQEANLQVVFDVQKKEYELAESRQKVQILTKNEQLQRANLKQAILIRNITIAFTLIVIIVSALLYRMVLLYRKGMRKIAKSNSLLEKLVSEKEWLLKEIHHRVKNNLHTVLCLLESQAAFLEKDALKAVDESRHRIYAMSLIHQKLYETENVKTIDINNYVTALVHYLRDCYDLKNNITFQLDIAPVLIDASIAIPIGLIVNEAITNAIKYAFVEKDEGQVIIRLYEEAGKIIVIVADNGVGIDMDILNQPTQSMGLRLMRGLCGDIGATILFKNDGGTQISLTCNRVLLEEDGIDMEELLNNIQIQDAIES